MEAFHRPVHDAEGIKACLDDHGVVAVTGVLSKDECEETLADIGALAGGVDFRDPATFHLAKVNRFGVVGDGPLFTPVLMRNRVRCAPVFAAAYGLPVHALVAQHDRAAFMRPVKLDATYDTPYEFPGLHLDVDPQCWAADDGAAAVRAFLGGLTYAHTRDFIAENNAKHVSMGPQLQGVLSLIDNRYEDGGFQCVPMPDARAWLKGFAASTVFPSPPEANGKYVFDAKSYGTLAAAGYAKTRVPCPAGTLILFDACLPHGTEPNRSRRPRAIQFVRYMPTSTLWVDPRARNAAIERVCRGVAPAEFLL
jgi:hypothetical protein